ncbi:hypothetical protein G2W53_013391 [Senna tora]|uniref:Uncharacterized protein n=1 Tax=Senna tora TaxID=362788 RepID=A0A834TYF9_9FABA|nr:hypothetical protein G2W53_013391 [Senna tora]
MTRPVLRSTEDDDRIKMRIRIATVPAGPPQSRTEMIRIRTGVVVSDHVHRRGGEPPPPRIDPGRSRRYKRLTHTKARHQMTIKIRSKNNSKAYMGRVKDMKTFCKGVTHLCHKVRSLIDFPKDMNQLSIPMPIYQTPNPLHQRRTRRVRKYPLHIIGHLVRAPPRRTRGLHRQLAQEGHLVHGPRVHEEEDRVQPLPPARRRRVKERPHPVVHGHRHYPVASGEFLFNPLRVHVSRPREADGWDGGEELREAGDGVGDGGDLAAEYGGEDHGVHEGAVGADEEDAGVAGGGGDGWGRFALDDDLAAEEGGEVGRGPEGEE